jgi:CDP-diacylglycerol--glycerol-3-phosphate 3-phosphatidyltransferase
MVRAADYKASNARWSISNAISFFRILLIVPTVIALRRHDVALACSMMLGAYITDLADGYVARKRHTVTEFGKIIDPLADKIFVIIVILTMADLGLVPMWFFLIVIIRDLLILIGGIWAKRRFGVVLPSNWVGKIAVFFIALSLFLAVLGVSQKDLLFFWVLSSALIGFSVFAYAKRLADLISAEGIRS